MKSYEIGQAINALCPGAEFTLVGDNYADIVWLKPPATVPTQADLENWLATPPPPPTPLQKLESAGLTVTDLKTLLGLPL